MDRCEEWGGSLASVSTQREQDLLLGLNLTSSYWVGLRSRGQSWDWLDGTTGPSFKNGAWNWTEQDVYSQWSSGAYSNWHTNSKKLLQNQRLCAFIDPTGKWHESSCTENKPFICKKQNSYCPIDWEYKWFDYKRTYADAITECHRWKGNLASIGSPEEELIIKKLHPDRRHSWYPAWMGLNDRQVDRKFAWTDGTGSSYRNWAYKEPSNKHMEDCVAFRYMKANGDKVNWNDRECASKLRFICKRCYLDKRVDEKVARTEYAIQAGVTLIVGVAIVTVVVLVLCCKCCVPKKVR